MSKDVKKLYGNYKKIQDIYDNDGLTSRKLYLQLIAYIKKLLHKYLLQKQFSEDNINDCFLAIYERVSSNYNADKGCLGNFIHTIVRNYCTKVNYKLVNHQKPISLDFEYINKDELRLAQNDSLSDYEDIDDNNLDNIENYCRGLKCDNVFDEVENYHDVCRQLKSLKELDNTSLDHINTLNVVRKDLLWNMWKNRMTL